MEYGPGDVPGIGLLMFAHGATSVKCVDRFPMMSLSERNVAALRLLIEDLSGDARQRAERCFVRRGEPRTGFVPGTIDYLVRPSGLSGLQSCIDLIVSRAVLEHVDDVSASFRDMYAALRPKGIAVHQVDRKSHGLHGRNPLDFLTWPPVLWRWMYSQKGVPNRWRVDRYRTDISGAGLELRLMEPTALAEKAEIDEVRPHLADLFREIPDEDLAWLGFWLVIRKSANRQAPY